MRPHIVRIDRPRGIRIPKPVLQQAEGEAGVQLRGRIVVATAPRLNRPPTRRLRLLAYAVSLSLGAPRIEAQRTVVPSWRPVPVVSAHSSVAASSQWPAALAFQEGAGRRTRRTEGAVVGGIVVGFLGAVTGLGLCHFDAPCHHPAPFVIGGFVAGAAAGAALGALIGEGIGKYSSDQHVTAPHLDGRAAPAPSRSTTNAGSVLPAITTPRGSA